MKEIPQNLRGWLLSDTFTIKEAACLWIGINPHDKEPGTGFWPVANSLARAVEHGELPADVVMQTVTQDDEDTGATITLHGPNWERTRIAGSALAAWAHGQVLPPVFPFEVATPPSDGAKSTTLESRLGGFWTENLEHLCATVDHFYKDLPKGAKYPTSAMIVEWLMSERGLDRKPAESIDAIIRPDDHPHLAKARRNISSHKNGGRR